jgi:O-antigen/teichoic acid export membrane protein
MSSDLKQTAAKGSGWSAIERLGSQGTQFLFGIILTRILLPEDYGMVGLVLIFIAVGQTLVDAGFSSALIWKKNTTQTDYSSVYYFNIGVSLIIYIFFFFLAPLIARFYEKPELITLIRVICLNFIILSFGVIQQTILYKNFDIKTLAKVNFIGSLLGGILSVILALKGFGVWAIVVQILSKNIISTALLWIFNSWRPIWVFSMGSIKSLFNYGSKIMIAGLLYSIFQNLYFVIIGKIFPIVTLGYYTRAVQLSEFPVTTVSSIFQRITFPVFSILQDETERLKNAVRKSLRTIVFILYPVMFGLMASSDIFIELMFSAKWLPASIFFKLLCILGLLYPFLVINDEVLKAKGRSGLLLKLQIISKVIIVINFVITYRWGISAIIIGQIVSVFITFSINAWITGRLITYSQLQQLRDTFPYLLISLIMGILISFIPGLIPDKILALSLMVFSGIVLYGILAYVSKMAELREIFDLAKQMVKK